jgi:hypothetical protein
VALCRRVIAVSGVSVPDFRGAPVDKQRFATPRASSVEHFRKQNGTCRIGASPGAL